MFFGAVRRRAVRGLRNHFLKKIPKAFYGEFVLFSPLIRAAAVIPLRVRFSQAREGYGGGFNERQDRASVATVEVDEDGYDDFGRKKIKARADKKAKEVRAEWKLRVRSGSQFFHVGHAYSFNFSSFLNTLHLQITRQPR